MSYLEEVTSKKKKKVKRRRAKSAKARQSLEVKETSFQEPFLLHDKEEPAKVG